MNILKEYLSNHPKKLSDWLDQFPWDSFDAEIIVPEDTEEEIVIAKKAILQQDAEITSLLICREAELDEGAEITGTMVCDTGTIGRDAECNYLIARSIVVGEDAEIRSAIVSDSIKMADGAEVDEVVILDSTFIDIHGQSLIEKRKILSGDDFEKAMVQRLQLVLESATGQFE